MGVNVSAPEVVYNAVVVSKTLFYVDTVVAVVGSHDYVTVVAGERNSQHFSNLFVFVFLAFVTILSFKTARTENRSALNCFARIF